MKNNNYDNYVFKNAVGIVVILIIILLILIIVIWYLNHYMVFWPCKEISKKPNRKKTAYHNLYIDVECPNQIYKPGQPRPYRCINVWHFDQFNQYRRGHTATTILYFHGNTGNISDRSYVIDICRRFNLNLLLVDYRGYGLSDCQPSPQNIFEDGEAAYRYLANKIDPDEIVIWGESLGGAVACHVASKHKARALILLSTFSSLEDVTRASVWPHSLANFMLMVSNCVFHPMNSAACAENIKCPVVIMHSKIDSLIPYHCGKTLYKNIGHRKKKFYEIGGDHGAPIISNATFKDVLTFSGIQAECMTSDIRYVTKTLTKITEHNPNLLPAK